MSPEADQVIAVRMPQVNVNDEHVRLVGWRVADGEQATAGQPLAEVETSKSVDEVPSPSGGVVRHQANVGDEIGVGEIFAYVGPSSAAIDAHLSASGTAPATAAKAREPQLAITAGAMALARRYGIDPAKIPAQGRIRREDIERFAGEQGLAPAESSTPPVIAVADEVLPPALQERVDGPRELAEHQWGVAQHLSRTRLRLVPSHVAMDVPMERVAGWVEARRKAGAMTGPLPAIMWAVGLAIKSNPAPASFRLGRKVYAYRSIDVAYTARSRDGRLFTPVVREVDRRSPEELLQECGRLNMAVFRGQLKAEELTGGCMTLSLLTESPVLFHVGVQNAYQSAILTMGAIRQQVTWRDGQAAPGAVATMILSYDHGLLDGWVASAFLDQVSKALADLEPS